VLRRYELASTTQLAQLQEGQATRLGGIISKMQMRLTKQNKSMAILTVEDLDGAAEVVVFPDAYARCSQHLKADAPIFLCGTVTLKEDKPKLYADQALPLADVPRRFTKAVHLRIPAAAITEETFGRVRDILQAHRGPVPVLFCFIYPDGRLVFMETHEEFSVTPTEELVGQLESLLGEEVVWLKADTEKLAAVAANAAPRRQWERKPGTPQKAIQWDSNRPEKS
jgi:DNA polymerase-3 subunit alpha